MKLRLMSLEEKREFFSRKEFFLKKISEPNVSREIEKGIDGWERYRDWLASQVDPNDSAEECDYDPQRAARVLNDYQRDLLEDLVKFPSSFLNAEDPHGGSTRSYLSLNSELGELKCYPELEYMDAYATLIRKNHLEETSKKGAWCMSWRAKKVLLAARELSLKAEEDLEAISGLGSFYNFDDVL